MGKKIYKFKTETEEDCEKWVDLIKKSQSSLSPIVIDPKTMNTLMKRTFDENLLPSSMLSPKLLPFHDENAKNFMKSTQISERETTDSFVKEDEDSIFARFFMLSENQKCSSKAPTNPKIEDEKLEYFQVKKRSWVSKYLCCCCYTKEQEENYYMHL